MLMRAWIGLVTLLAVAPGGTAHADLLERVRDGETIKVALNNAPPWAFYDDAGNLTGEVPVILRHVLDRMGKPNSLEPQVMEYGVLINGLRARRFDIIAAGMYVTPRKCESVAFTEPTMQVPEGFVVPAGNPKGIASYTDIRDQSDTVMAVVAGGVQTQRARNFGIPAEQIRTFSSNADAYLAVHTGRVDALATTRLQARLASQNWPERYELAITEPLYTVEGQSVTNHSALAVHPQEKRFLAAFNKHLKRFLGTEAHLDKVKPFGLTKANLPEKTTEELCRSQ